MIKILGVDLDGTCLTSDVKVTPETREALKEAGEKGVIVVPTTGRTLSIVPSDILDIPGIEYAITSNGAVIQNLKSGEVIYDQSIPKDSLKQILDIFKDYDLYCEYYVDGIDYIKNSEYDRTKEFVSENYWDLYFNDTTHLEDEEIDKILQTRDLEKINYRLHPDQSLRRSELTARLRAVPGLDVIDQVEGNGEITFVEANKGGALAALANMNGIDCSQAMAIGDSNNDISMLTFAGTGVAMGQAPENVKEAADFVTKSCDDNGVAYAVNKFILENEDDGITFDKELVERVKRANG